MIRPRLDRLSTLAAWAALALSAWLIPNAAQAAFDPSGCPSLNGQFKHNGQPRGTLLKITTHWNGKSLFYNFGGVRYVVDGTVHTLAGSTVRYAGGCSDNTLIISSYGGGQTALLKVSDLGGTGVYTMETSAGESTADQFLVDIDRIGQLPPHTSSQCPAEMNEAYRSKNRPFDPDKKQFILIEPRKNGIDLYVDEQFPVEGTRVPMRGRLVQGVCFEGVVYVNTYESDGTFVAQEVFYGLGKREQVHVVAYVGREGGKHMAYHYSRMYTDDGQLVSDKPMFSVPADDEDEDEDDEDEDLD